MIKSLSGALIMVCGGAGHIGAQQKILVLVIDYHDVLIYSGVHSHEPSFDQQQIETLSLHEPKELLLDYRLHKYAVLEEELTITTLLQRSKKVSSTGYTFQAIESKWLVKLQLASTYG